MSPMALEEAGFKEFPVPPMWNCTRLWGYARKDARGRQFNINVRYYDLRKYHYNAESWDAISQFWFRINDRECTTNVELMDIEGMSPEDIIDWFHSVWQDMGAHYEKKWGE